MPFWESLPGDRVLAEFSLWSADLTRLAAEIERTEPYADLYHIDASDGHFAPLLLFFPDLVARLRPLTRTPLHVHLMAEGRTLFRQIGHFAEAGADLITIHCENGHAVPEALDHLQRIGVSAGLALGLETAPECVIPYLDRIALITVLGTRIGIKGQDLSERACPRIRAMRRIIREHGAAGRVFVAADGGIRPHTVPDLRLAGADTVVMGSLAFDSPDLAATSAWLRALPGPQPA